MERTPGTDLFAAKQSDPALIAELAKLPMSELERPRGGSPTLRGHTPMHELMATLIDQVAELRIVTTATARLIDYQGPQRYVQRPDTPIEAAKKLRIKSERSELDQKIERLRNGGG